MKFLIINLDDRVYRYKRIYNQLVNFGILDKDIVRISAIRGDSLSDDFLNEKLTLHARYLLDYPKERSAHLEIPSKNAVGCYLSHLKCLQYFQDSSNSDNSFCILEDDAIFHSRLNATTFQDLLAKGQNSKQDLFFLGYHFKANHVHFGAFAYIVKRRAIDTIQKNAFPIEIQYDAYLDLLGQQKELAVCFYGKDEYVTAIGNSDTQNFPSIYAYQWKLHYSHHQISILIIICVLALLILGIITSKWLWKRFKK